MIPIERDHMCLSALPGSLMQSGGEIQLRGFVSIRPAVQGYLIINSSRKTQPAEDGATPWFQDSGCMRAERDSWIPSWKAAWIHSFLSSLDCRSERDWLLESLLWWPLNDVSRPGIVSQISFFFSVGFGQGIELQQHKLNYKVPFPQKEGTRAWNNTQGCPLASTHTCSCVLAALHTQWYPCTCMHMHACSLSLIYTHKHACAHTYTHTVNTDAAKSMPFPFLPPLPCLESVWERD